MFSLKNVLFFSFLTATLIFDMGLLLDILNQQNNQSDVQVTISEYDSEYDAPPQDNGILYDRIFSHIERVNGVAGQLKYLADYSDTSSSDDEQVVALVNRINDLNNEREEILTSLSASPSVTPGLFKSISSIVIYPSWQALDLAADGLERAAAHRSSP